MSQTSANYTDGSIGNQFPYMTVHYNLSMLPLHVNLTEVYSRKSYIFAHL